MESPSRSSNARRPALDEEPRARIAAYTTRPDRVVFTEDGNTDGWISTDLTVSLER